MTDRKDFIDLRIDGSIAVLMLNSPQNRNALSVASTRALRAALAEAEADKEVRVAVLTGAGDAFSAGGDVVATAELMRNGTNLERKAAHAELQQLILAIRNSRLVIVASVHGSAYGAGYSLALACDLIVATPSTKFCSVFLKLSVAPDMGNAWFLPRSVGAHRAKQMMFLASPMLGDEAHRVGVVCQLEETPEKALARAIDIARQVAKSSSTSLAWTKLLINRSEGVSLEESLLVEQAAQAVVLEDSVEGFVNALKK